MNYLLLLVLSLLSFVASAKKEVPESCNPLAVQGETLMLSVDKPQVMLIHNSSNLDLWVTHPVSDPGASAGFSSRIQAGKWSALVVDQKAFELSCIESKPGHEQQIPCTGTINVCQWSEVTLPNQSSGIFWAAENMELPALITHLGSNGFGLPSLGQ